MSENVVNEVKFPEVTVELVGQDGNAFAILGKVADALCKAGHGDAVGEYMNEAMSGDYKHVLQVTCQTVDVR